MNKKTLILVVSVLAIIGFWTYYSLVNKTESSDKMTSTKIESSSYWTCPMHPQIHQAHAGECPICHMKLVKVAQTAQMQNAKNDPADKRSPVQATPGQLELIGIQKELVEKMTLKAGIPVSGRILSSSTVAFQVYENDLRYIHSGLLFKGEGNITSEDEISGVITSVDSVVDPSSRTVRVIGAIHKGPKRLLSETSVTGEIQIELKDRLAIPESSVLHTGNGDFVYLIDDQNKLTPKKVKLGIKTEGFYEVLSGLHVNDFISSGPNFLIDSEAKIRGASEPIEGQTRSANPSCPKDQHWDIPMAMCMPGKASK